MIKILYRPQRATIDESMQEIKYFESIKDMAEYLSEFWDCAVDDIYVSYYCYDGRIGWETYVVTIGETEKENYCKQYGCPQAIGFMTIIEDKIESGELCDREEVRKETAREILKMLVGHEMRDKGAHMAWVIVKQDVTFIAEKYGIDLFEKTDNVEDEE